jgi:adenine phosphoribosyltransferase
MAAMMPGLRPFRHHLVDLRQYVRDIPDFPKPGILFRDITPLLRDPAGWHEVIQRLVAVCDRWQPDLIVGIESRGFIVGTALATQLGKGFVPVRKPGKLPGEVIGIDYTLEYGSDRLEIHADALADHPKVLLVDDLLATGGTASASAELVTKAGGELVGCGFVIELADLAGRAKLPEGLQVESLIIYG